MSRTISVMDEGLGILLLAFAIAVTVVVYWRVVLALLVASGLAIFLVGLFQVVTWFQASS